MGPYRVLDITDEKGFYCAKLLAELGADVIILEPPGGHPARHRGPFYRDQVHPEKSLYWFALNTSKRSITLNLETRDGQALFRELVKTAHFIVESQPAGFLDGLGLGYQALAQIRPDIIVTSITPFGSTGPYSSYQGTDMVCQAMGGLMFPHGGERSTPHKLPCDQAYFQAGLQAGVATLTAHYRRLRTGVGQRVDVSVQEAGAGATSPGTAPQPVPWQMQTVRCQDGYVALSLRSSSLEAVLQWMEDSGWEIAQLKGRQWTATDIASLTGPERQVLGPLLHKLLTQKTREEVREGARQYRLPWAPLQSPTELLDDSHLADRGFFIPVRHEGLKEAIPYPGPPARLTATPWRIQVPAPGIGEHNLEIYVKELGLTPEELTMLKAVGAI
ncbi:MAG: CoA transferase [Chloroflexi bacterium]|nr:CoA transferase [Chloroflexota bacterium]